MLEQGSVKISLFGFLQNGGGEAVTLKAGPESAQQQAQRGLPGMEGGRTVSVTVDCVWIQPQADFTMLPPTLDRLDQAAQLPVHGVTAFLTFGAGVTGDLTAMRAAAGTVVVTVAGAMGNLAAQNCCAGWYVEKMRNAL